MPTVTPVATTETLGPENIDVGKITAKEEKERGILRFEVITNDSTSKNLELLINLKNVFSKQLPKMPREYIVRLMFDRFHESLLIIKNNNVIGGICFRPFRDQGFIEIAFCAITSSEQVKGYGSFLMTHLKEYNRKTGIYHFLTFADNFAIEYFQKQGFTHEITLAKEKWKGFIQEYDGGSLMECVVHPNVTYLDIPSMVRRQRDVLNAKIREISTSHLVNPGLKFFKNGERRIAIESIRGIKESGWINNVDEAQIQNLQIQLGKALVEIKNHEDSWPFQKAVSLDEAPNYYNVVKDPVDLQMISDRLAANNYYITKNIFLADLKRMCNNCREFNGEGTVYFEVADRLEKFCKNLINNIK
ncbi:histone acetyl transferase [Dictyostelium purpureum]|uniref:histone acetyltransferase n=1 Tax=Dictyostelium purpureum TaxID=5786 RepID=F0Z8L9_DICPU|nr:histone acetyl transferase [Dictyostelium purpureum]EGC39711.1 histone acetyl transferase [Dictyostelium purpureum]|eukprot:XP_003283697.1 histone acetyl transferase [Dictyostelium purpureum]